MMLCVGPPESKAKRSESAAVCIGAGSTRQCFPTKRSESCTFGEAKKIDCNSCICAEYQGEPFWLCTMMSCPAKKEIMSDSEATCVSAGGTLQCFPSRREEAECEVGETKKEDCNSCVCAGGQWACTMMFCLGAKKARAIERRKLCVQAGNVRQCFERRSAVDNLRSLVDKAVVEEKGVCSEEEVKMKDCNTCLCIGGEWMCTMRMCRAINRIKRDQLITGQEKRAVCHDEDVKRKDCNICVCLGGEWMCTQRMCRAIKPIKRVA